MDLKSFRQEIVDIRPMLQAWGDLVTMKIKESRIPLQLIQCRVKDADSAVGKISRKKYENPMVEMTDLVGVRVVVLLTPELECIRHWVISENSWNAKISRDPDLEMAEKPEKFDYQSLHFEIRAEKEYEFQGEVIPAGTCCEFQARTLMQHAYAEVVHDNIYKSSWPAPTRAKRYVASSAALISTADHLFCETMELLETDNKEMGQLLECLTDLYDKSILVSANGRDKKLNMIVLDAFSSYINERTCKDVAILLESKRYVASNIRDRLNDDPFWVQPVSLLSYWLVKNWPEDVFTNWPFASSHDALRLVYSDLGENP